jgi:chloramphenicol-sensitive protein RarD
MRLYSRQAVSTTMATSADLTSVPTESRTGSPAVAEQSAAACADARRTRAGLAFGLGAYLAWGFIPAYFKLLSHVPPLTVLAHRVVWSVAFLALLLTLMRKWGEVRDALRRRRTMLALLCSTVLIATNWYVFIWAIDHGKLLEASLGYFINPLVNVLLGVAVLRERLTPGQIAGLVLAGAGVANMTLGAGGVPWVALSLAVSFAFYGLLRKTAPVAPLAGLSIETAILFPVALLLVTGAVPLPGGHGAAELSGRTYAMLSAAGVITAVPLLWFAAGARRLRLSTMGFIQYLAPTCQFLLAVVAYDEPFSTRQLVSFALIWAALGAYTLESVLRLRAARPHPQHFCDEPAAVPE